MCSCVCACEQIARTRSGDKGLKNVPAPARVTPPINPENYTLRFPQDKKWVVQNSCPKVGLSFFGKKGQHFCDSIRSGLTFVFIFVSFSSFCFHRSRDPSFNRSDGWKPKLADG